MVPKNVTESIAFLSIFILMKHMAFLNLLEPFTPVIRVMGSVVSEVIHQISKHESSINTGGYWYISNNPEKYPVDY